MSDSPRAFVIGHPIAHSRSPLIHAHWLGRLGLRGVYEKIDVAPAALPAFLAAVREGAYLGGNVTVPHKEAALAQADGVDAAAQAIGAVNTLWRENGRLIGGNTDGYGFLANLDAQAPGWDVAPSRAIVLGAGGAARAVVNALRERGFKVAVLNRTPGRAEVLARAFPRGVEVAAWTDLPAVLTGAALLVNTTSLGMAGQPTLDIDLGTLTPGAVVADIVYVPLETALLRAARRAGHRAVDGLGMLLHQAAPGFERWFGVRPEVTPDLRAAILADLAAPRP